MNGNFWWCCWTFFFSFVFFLLLLVRLFWAATLFYFRALYIRLLLLFPLFALGGAKSARAACDGVPFGRSGHIIKPVMHLIANGDHCSHFCLQELCTLFRYPLSHGSSSPIPCPKTAQSTPRPASSPLPTSLLAPSDPPNFFYPVLSHPSTKISAAVLPANPQFLPL